jgi:hypothetical protein
VKKTAEKQKVRRKESTPKMSEAEKREKLAKLKVLKEKLAVIEAEEDKKVPVDSSKLGSNVKKQTQEVIESDSDNYYSELDTELADLEAKLAKDISIDNLEISTEIEEKISEDLEKSKILKKPDHKAALTKKDLKDVDAELEKLEAEIELEQKKAAVIVSLFDQLSEEHEWIKEPQYGFMYSIPDKKKDKKNFESWIDDWSKVLFDYAKIASNHIIYSKTILSEKPWSDFKDRTSAIQEITNNLVKQKVAEWLGKKKEKLRIYWLSLEEWADKIVLWAHEIAFTEPIFVTDIKEAEQDFSSLPEEDIIKTFNIIAKQGNGTKIKLENDQIAIQIKFN